LAKLLFILLVSVYFNRTRTECFFHAARRGDKKLVKVLISLGADIEIVGKMGTVRDIAVKENHGAIVYLIDSMFCVSDEQGIDLCSEECTSRESLFKSRESLSDSLLFCKSVQLNTLLESEREGISHDLGVILSDQQREKLHLVDMKLTSIPIAVFELTSLRELNLSNNAITFVPPEIKKLTALRKLKLDSNKLTSLPMELGYMTHLKELTLSLNTGLPPIIKKKAREGVPALLQYLRKYGDGAPSAYFFFKLHLTIHSHKNSRNNKIFSVAARSLSKEKRK
jgi:hypothetical protein